MSNSATASSKADNVKQLDLAMIYRQESQEYKCLGSFENTSCEESEKLALQIAIDEAKKYCPYNCKVKKIPTGSPMITYGIFYEKKIENKSLACFPESVQQVELCGYPFLELNCVFYIRLFYVNFKDLRLN